MKKEIFAKIKYVPMSPRKVRLVADMVRGKGLLEAIEMLKFVNKAASLPVRKALESALANATFNYENDRKLLIVSTSFVDEAPMFKRGRAISRGRYRRILKRNSHITVGVREKGPIVKEDETLVKKEIKKDTKLKDKVKGESKKIVKKENKIAAKKDTVRKK